MVNNNKILRIIIVVTFAVTFLTILIFDINEFSHSSLSPNKEFRLDYYIVSSYRSIFHINKEMPGFVELYRNADNTLLRKSGVFEMEDSGPVFWDDDSVIIGTTLNFENLK